MKNGKNLKNEKLEILIFNNFIFFKKLKNF